MSLLSAGSQICGKHQGYKSRDPSLETQTGSNLVTMATVPKPKNVLPILLFKPDRNIINILGIIKNWSNLVGSPALIRLCSHLLNWVLFILRSVTNFGGEKKRIKRKSFYWDSNYFSNSSVLQVIDCVLMIWVLLSVFRCKSNLRKMQSIKVKNKGANPLSV